MAITNRDRLRQMLGEDDVDDSNFTDEWIDDLLIQGGGDLNLSALLGWRLLAAKFAHIVTTSEGNASREASKLQDHALKMIAQYEGVVSGRPRTRLGPITRPGGTGL